MTLGYEECGGVTVTVEAAGGTRDAAFRGATSPSPSALIGPLPVGLVGGLGFAAVALWMLARWGNEKIPAGQQGGVPSHAAAGRSRARTG